jgi:hypothetical protein
VVLLLAATEAAAETAGRGAGGGRRGADGSCKRAFFNASISCRSAVFSDLVEPKLPHIASMRRSCSAMSISRVVMYSVDHISNEKQYRFFY